MLRHDAIAFVFSTDAQGDVALEAARQVAKLIRDWAFRVHPDLLRTFSALPLRVHVDVDEAMVAELASQANAKRRKRDRETAEIEAELREGKATVNKIVLARRQSDTLQAVTLTYFRVLKSVDLTTNAASSSFVVVAVTPHCRTLAPGTGRFGQVCAPDQH